MKAQWPNLRAIIHASTQFSMVKVGPAWFSSLISKGCISGCRSTNEMGVKSAVFRNNRSLRVFSYYKYNHGLELFMIFILFFIIFIHPVCGEIAIIMISWSCTGLFLSINKTKTIRRCHCSVKKILLILWRYFIRGCE